MKKGRNTSLLNFSFVGVGGQSIISHHNHVSFKEREHLVFQPDLTSVERGKCFLYFFFSGGHDCVSHKNNSKKMGSLLVFTMEIK